MIVRFIKGYFFYLDYIYTYIGGMFTPLLLPVLNQIVYIKNWRDICAMMDDHITDNKLGGGEYD